MKKFTEGLKDFIYDAIDYILIILIIVVVVAIIGWRLDVLFANDVGKISPIKDKKIERKIDKDNGKSNKSSKDIKSEESKENSSKKEEATTSETKTITIPKGSTCSMIANILYDENLIEDKDIFLNKVDELKMDSKLKYGEFQINTGSSIEEILDILSK